VHFIEVGRISHFRNERLSARPFDRDRLSRPIKGSPAQRPVQAGAQKATSYQFIRTVAL
jgi:hypothetical protein